MVDRLNKILLDIPSETDLLDFEKYSTVISKIIIDNEPRFSVGIFGEWGAGKTTMMQMILHELEQFNHDNSDTYLCTVWFNAWNYEKETNYATLPLFRCIYEKLEEIKDLHSNATKTKKDSIVFKNIEKLSNVFRDLNELSYKSIEKD